MVGQVLLCQLVNEAAASGLRQLLLIWSLASQCTFEERVVS